MPYITQQQRESLHQAEYRPSTAGELNYMFTALAKQYIDDNGLSYKSINDILGALTGAQMEFYRRVAQPYEDVKKDLNGDVY